MAACDASEQGLSGKNGLPVLNLEFEILADGNTFPATGAPDLIDGDNSRFFCSAGRYRHGYQFKRFLKGINKSAGLFEIAAFFLYYYNIHRRLAPAPAGSGLTS
jgi:hypothetical protein